MSERDRSVAQSTTPNCSWDSPTRARSGHAYVGDVDAYSLAEFCRRHGISLQMYYKLVTQGLGPQTFNVGTRVLVSKEAAAEWRREREAAAKVDQSA